MPIIDLTDDELAASDAAIRRAIDEDRFPRAPRLGMARSRNFRDLDLPVSASTPCARRSYSRARRHRRHPKLGEGKMTRGAAIAAPSQGRECG
jgi:hypothetical protein